MPPRRSFRMRTVQKNGMCKLWRKRSAVFAESAHFAASLPLYCPQIIRQRRCSDWIQYGDRIGRQRPRLGDTQIERRQPKADGWMGLPPGPDQSPFPRAARGARPVGGTRPHCECQRQARLRHRDHAMSPRGKSPHISRLESARSSSVRVKFRSARIPLGLRNGICLESPMTLTDRRTSAFLAGGNNRTFSRIASSIFMRFRWHYPTSAEHAVGRKQSRMFFARHH